MTGAPMTDAELAEIRARVGDHLARSAADGFPLPAVVADPIIPLLAEVDRLRAANGWLYEELSDRDKSIDGVITENDRLRAENAEVIRLWALDQQMEVAELARLRAHGLTWADVDWARACASRSFKAGDRSHARELDTIADKIAALLPPRDPTPEGTT